MQNLISCRSGSKRSELSWLMNLLPKAAISSVLRNCSARCRSTTPLSFSGDQTTRKENLLWSLAYLSNKLSASFTKAWRAYQTAKANAAKIISRFFWPDLKRDVRLYVACCPTCERFLRLGRNPRSEMRPMSVGGRGDCVFMNIVGGKGSLSETPLGNNYIFIDCFICYALAIPLPDQSSAVIISAILETSLQCTVFIALFSQINFVTSNF